MTDYGCCSSHIHADLPIIWNNREDTTGGDVILLLKETAYLLETTSEAQYQPVAG